MTAPGKPAWVMVPSGASITHGELDRRSARVAHLLDGLGLAPTATVAVVAENRLEWAELVWGCLRSGRYLAPVNWHLGPDGLAAALSGCAADLVVTTDLTSEAVAAVVGDVPVVALGPAYEGRLDGLSDHYPGSALMGGRVMFSSGTTTGRPKAIRHEGPGCPVAQAPPHLGGYTDLFALTSGTVYLSPAPTYHTAPVRFVTAVLQLGGTVVSLDRFDPAVALAAIEEHRVTHAQFVPTMLVRMLHLPDDVREAADTSSLQVAITGAAPCPIELKARVADWWGPVLHELYGASESYGNCHIGPHEAAERPGSVGRALVGTIHVTDDDGRELPVGRTGTVWFEGTAPFRYADDDGLPAPPQGWATVGDLGHLDADGYLYLDGRGAHTIITGGVNVSPAAAEEVLTMHPDVADAAVIGVPDPELGERVVAVVVPRGPAGPGLRDELLEACRARLSRHETPTAVDLVDELPRGENGKLYKAALVRRYEEAVRSAAAP